MAKLLRSEIPNEDSCSPQNETQREEGQHQSRVSLHEDPSTHQALAQRRAHIGPLSRQLVTKNSVVSHRPSVHTLGFGKERPRDCTTSAPIADGIGKTPSGGEVGVIVWGRPNDLCSQSMRASRSSDAGKNEVKGQQSGRHQAQADPCLHDFPQRGILRRVF